MPRSISFGRVMQQEESEGQAFLTWFRRWFVLNSFICQFIFFSLLVPSRFIDFMLISVEFACHVLTKKNSVEFTCHVSMILLFVLCIVIERLVSLVIYSSGVVSEHAYLLAGTIYT